MIQQIDKDAVLEKDIAEASELPNTLVDENSEGLDFSIDNNVQLEDSATSTSSEVNNLENKDCNQSNCLALTVRKDYNLTIIKNIFTTSGRVSLKIAISTFILNILRMFF